MVELCVPPILFRTVLPIVLRPDGSAGSIDKDSICAPLRSGCIPQ
jgi:hypothetical protein